MSNQYVMVLNELVAGYINSMIKGVEFIPVSGLQVQNHDGYTFLVTPSALKQESVEAPNRQEPTADV